MSYKQAMEWGKTHRKGTKQPLIMSTGSGFWPSRSFMEEDFIPYLKECKAEGVEPMECQDYYNSRLRR